MYSACKSLQRRYILPQKNMQTLLERDHNLFIVLSSYKCKDRSMRNTKMHSLHSGPDFHHTTNSLWMKIWMKISSFSEHLKLYWHTIQNYFENSCPISIKLWNFTLSNLQLIQRIYNDIVYYTIQIFFKKYKLRASSIIWKHVIRYSVRKRLRITTLILSILNRYYISISLQLKEAEFCRQAISLLPVFTYNYNLISHMDSAIMFNSTAFCNAFHKDTRRFWDEKQGKLS